MVNKGKLEQVKKETAMKKIAIVRPAVHLVKDENGNTIRSDYSYAAAPNCHVEVLCYNRDQAPPDGDFLQEQMWVIEGPQESLDIFFSDSRVKEITHADCCTLGPQWDGPKAIKEPVASGSVACCPGCVAGLSHNLIYDINSLNVDIVQVPLHRGMPDEYVIDQLADTDTRICGKLVPDPKIHTPEFFKALFKRDKGRIKLWVFGGEPETGPHQPG